jgi:uncharacterized LabA/DUF88 family protein
VDRCALFVDASYVLADGAMAVHGTRRGESVSWDYEGLLQLLSGMAHERTGLPMLRCYWYEATVDGRRTAEQDALADMPGIKLRVAKIRPGRREGVETEIHRDLTTLARNSAVSDALVLSTEEDLTQVISDVQDLGMRVILLHIAVDGNWTISRALRQEADDIVEIGSEQLRPYVELIVGAEPARADEPDDADHADRVPARPLANGHSAMAGVGAFGQPPPGAANHVPPAIYTAAAVAEYQRPVAQLPRAERSRDERSRDERSRDERPREERTRDERPREERSREERPIQERPRDEWSRDEWSRDEWPREERSRDEWSREERPREDRKREDRGREDRGREDRAREPVNAEASAARVGYQGQQGAPETVSGLAAVPGLPATAGTETAQPGQLRRLPSRVGSPASPGPVGPIGPMGPAASGGPAPSGPYGGQGSARSAPYSGPQPVATSPPPGYQSPAPAGPGGSGAGVSLSEAVQAAHEEGQEFGASVARDAPALWLEAVLARKPRMPSDLEARLLQGSALPIDYLLHDEVRHALRRGFWDALERTRR